MSCGCPKGTQQHYTHDISDLLERLSHLPNDDSTFTNMFKATQIIEDKVLHNKVFALLGITNFKISDIQLDTIDVYSLEDIEYLVQQHSLGKESWLQFYDKRRICKKREKNFIGKLLVMYRRF